MQRLTHFTDFKGFKANQGVVSDDGKYLCFQIGKANQEAGVGFGFFILDLEEAEVMAADFRSEETILQFARRFGTHPEMIVGRLQRRGVLGHSEGAGVRVRIDWEGHCG